MEQLLSFCEFQQYGPSHGTAFLSPCRELLFLTLSDLTLLLFMVIAAVTGNSIALATARSRHTHSLVIALTSSLTAIALLLQMTMPFHPRYAFPAVLSIAHSLGTIVWLTNAALHFHAFYRKSPTQFPFVPTAVCAIAFLLVTAQRWLSFGHSDPRTLLSAVPFIAQSVSLVYSLGCSRRRRGWSQLREDSGELLNSHEHVNLFSQMFFCWTNPLLEKGYRRQLKQVEDVYHLPPSLELLRLERDIFSGGRNPATEPDFHFASALLLRAYGRPFFLLGIVRFVGDVFKFASPVLLHALISSLQSPSTLHTGYMCAGLMFLVLFLSSACDFHFSYHITMVSLRAKTALLLAVYEKLLHIPAHRLTDTFSSGNLINLMSNDVDRIGGFLTSFHAFWSMPMNFAIALYLLYREIGLAFLTGLLVSLLLIPLNKYVATKIGHFSKLMMQMKDARMKLVTELARSMRTVKLNNWELLFEAKIGAIRAKELANLRAMKYLDAVCVYLWASAPIVITVCLLKFAKDRKPCDRSTDILNVLMLSTYSALLHEPLTAARVFTTLALINILILPLNAFPWVLSSIINGMVSKRRFDAFFAIKCNGQPTAQPINNEEGEEGGEVLLRVNGTSFAWSDQKWAVKDVRFVGKRGALVGVVGPVGSGKSTLLLGLLGETRAQGAPLQFAESVLSDGIAYVGQDVWLREGSVLENVLCERQFRPECFQRAVDACALSYDIKGMPGQENYRISADGTTLSGGQKVRLALARAVYADKDVCLLDDPFAALDRSVARFVYENCLEELRREKLVILCTHHEHFLHNADLVIRLNAAGEVEKMGAPDEACSDNELQTIGEEEGNGDSRSSSPLDAAEPVGAEEFEEKEEGAVKVRVYTNYAQSIGTVLSTFILLSLLAMQFSKNGSDVWLSRWASANRSSPAHLLVASDWASVLFLPGSQFQIIGGESTGDRTNFYLGIYVSIAALNSLCTLARAFFFAYGCIVAAKSLHERILGRILNASLSWWDKTPVGRVTNRLSSDVAIVDDALPFQLNICLASVFSLAGTLLITLMALPLLAPLVLALFVVYFFIQKYYRRTTVELKRITALSLSPLYSHLSETVAGLVSIRALRISHRFSAMMRDRMAANLRAQFSSLACSQWLSVRIQMLGVSVCSAIAFFSVLDVSLFHISDPGLIGLAITYALTFTNLFNGLLCAFTETEKEMVSVERIRDYVDNVPAEQSEEGQAADPGGEVFGRLIARGIGGQIRFTGVSLRYAPDLPLAIRELSFHVQAGHRVAIIGRTGSGKSTILQALLRAHPIETGKMYIDEVVDLESLGLKSARSLFGFVSQHPFLFSGTLRDNLCMASTQLNDALILECVQRAGLADWLVQFGGLGVEIAEGGRNLSFGERQLISLLRLALTHPKIVLIDEATAHMDECTHMLMSQLVANMGCTVLAILHRTGGLGKYDWVIEMSNGQIARQGPPALLFGGNGQHCND